MDGRIAPKGDSEKLEGIHKAALEQFQRGLEADQHNREHALECAEFAVGNQWPDEIKRQREAAGRPCLTINRAPAILRQVTNEIRIKPPQINVLPAEDGDVQTANVIEGLIRSIENTSKAKRIYAKGMEDAARVGMGFWRIKTDYKDERSFDQEICLEHIENPLSVVVDPDARDPMGKDWQFAFILDAMTKDRFHEVFGEDATYGIDGDQTTEPDGYGDSYDGTWMNGDIVQVAEYFTFEETQTQLVMLEDGSVIYVDDYDDAVESYNESLMKYQEAMQMLQQDMAQAEANGIPYIGPTELEQPEAPPSVVTDEEGNPRTRDTIKRKVVSYIMSGKQILSGPHEHACHRIPIVPVWGEEYRVADRKVRQSVISNMMEPARIQNYMKSAAIEQTALAPKAPWLLTAKHIAGLERMWRTVGQGNPAFLLYNPDQAAPGGPQRIAPPPVQNGLYQDAAIAAEDIKATTGIYDAALGAQSNETSGRAITARKAEGDVSTYVYLDNLLHAVEETGRIILQMIPRIYDTERQIRILGKKDEADIIKVNDGGQFDLRIGKYDVVIKTGASYTTRREEFREMATEILRSAPMLAPILIPRIVSQMDIDDADEIVEEMKQMMQGGNQGPPPPDPKDMAQAEKYKADAVKTQAETEQIALDMYRDAIELERAGYSLPNMGAA